MNKIAFLTTIFPMKEQFLIDFFESLVLQTDKGFDVVVVNDGYANFNEIKLKYSMLNIVELKHCDTPAKNREYGINYCIECRYEKLIFGDSDDYFSENRVEASIELLSVHEIVVNDVSLFNDTGIYEEKYMSHRLRDKTKVRLDFIKDKNIFGLSNTALRTSILNKVHFDKDLVAVDWYFYTNLLKQKYNAIFTNGAITYYRQHNDNTVGLKVINDNYYLWFENELED